MKHSEAFIEKHKRLIETREKAALEKAKTKALRKEETYKRKLEKQRERAKKIKEDPEKYKAYLDYMKEYHHNLKMKTLEKRTKKIQSILEGEKYGIVFSKSGLIHYVTDKGCVYNKTGLQKKPSINKNGYRILNLGGKESKMLHRVVWQAFNGEIPQGYEIDHIIPIKNGGTDELSNLRLVTHKENCNNPISVENYSKHNKTVDRSYLKKYYERKTSKI